MRMTVGACQATASNVKGSDRWQIINLELFRSTSELAWNLNFHRKQANQAFDVQLGTNVGQGLLLQMASRKITIASENLEVFHFFLNFKKSLIFDLMINLLSNLSCYLHLYPPMVKQFWLTYLAKGEGEGEGEGGGAHLEVLE